MTGLGRNASWEDRLVEEAEIGLKVGEEEEALVERFSPAAIADDGVATNYYSETGFWPAVG
jgi:hypothetical protein